MFFSVLVCQRVYLELSPGMIWRRNRSFLSSWRFLFFGPCWPRRYLVICQVPTLVGDVYAAIQSFLYHHRLHTHPWWRILDLIQPAVISHGKIISHHPLFPHREDAFQIGPPGDRTVKISPLLWRDAESAVIPGQIAVQKPIGLPPGADTG